MKQIGIALQICLTSILLLSGCQASKIDQTAPQELPAPPKPTIAWNDKTAVAVPTSSCWSYDSQATCRDTAAPPEVIGEQKPAPLQVQPGAILTITYEQPPLEKSLVLTQWIGTDQVRQELKGGNKWKAPEQPGWYLFDVRARWQQGDAGHAFVIEVRSDMRDKRL